MEELITLRGMGELVVLGWRRSQVLQMNPLELPEGLNMMTTASVASTTL